MTSDRDIPTLDDVAKAAGVSTATVSRCMNGAQNVSESTRVRVNNAVEALGYTPHFGARAMAAKRTHTIGAIIPTMENAIFAKGLQAFQEQLHERGYTLLVSSTGYSAAVEAEQIRALVARGADGILLIGYARDQALYDLLARRRVPVLVAWAAQSAHPIPAIGFDNRAAMRALAEKVLASGHTRIAMISGVTAGNDRATARIAGVRDALGTKQARLQVIEAPYTIDAGAQAFRHIMQQSSQPTAVLCGNDVLAVGAMREAQHMGLDVPRDVSITGFDDLELASIVTPPLTTVHVPHRQMGTQAADALVDMVETGQTCQSVTLDSGVVERASLCPPVR